MRRFARRPVHAVLPLAALLASPAQHMVQPGETVSEIAADHGVTTRALAEANSLPDPDRVRAGTTLTIPGGDLQAAGGARTHVVRPGETLSRIAAVFGVRVAVLAAANGITRPDVVWAGRQLQVPTGDGEVTASPGGPEGVRRHVVASGETLSGIAAHYGVTVDEIVDANSIADRDAVRAGQTLTIGQTWRCPVAGDVDFVDDYGVPKGDGRFHQGIDLFAPRGTAVVAPVAGRVEHVEGRVGGLQTWLWGDDGHLYIGTHLDAFAGGSGPVDAGEQLGTVGSTGNARGTRPHLHFEMHLGSVAPTSPFPLLAETCAR